MKKIALLMIAGLFVAFTSCKKDDEKTYVYQDGTYKAEDAEFSHNYKAFLEAEIKADQLVSVNFDYVDSVGNFKSNTTAEQYPMDPHPSSWLPECESQLMSTSIVPDYIEIDGVSGATHGSESANIMMEAVLAAAKSGDHTVQIIPAPAK